MNEAFDMYNYVANNESSKREYLDGSIEGEWPRQKFLEMRSLIEKEIMVSKCLREDPSYFLASEKEKMIEMIPLAHIEALYAWINKSDMDDVRKNPAFYGEVIKEVEKRRNGHF